MKREASTPRPDALSLVEADGLSYARETQADGTVLPYWNEDAAYRLASQEVDGLERITGELHAMSMAATVEMAKRPDVLRRLGLPEGVGPAIRQYLDDHGTWSLYGRFDLAYGDGCAVPKMLEYNADTPAGLVEAASTQWSWLEALDPDGKRDQWTMMDEMLVQTWGEHHEPGDVVHLAAGAAEPPEDWNTVAYLADTVARAGLHPVTLSIEDLGFQEETRALVDTTAVPQRYIATLFRMYPAEWLLDSAFGKHWAYGGLQTRILEPLYKVLTGSKALLPMLWELYPDHPNLLPAYWEDDPQAGTLADYVVKPVFGWEGKGVTIVKWDGITASDPGHTGDQAKVYQEYVDLPDHDGWRPVLGTWVVGGQAAGLGIRESRSLVTDTGAQFTPHYIDAPRSTPEQVAAMLAR